MRVALYALELQLARESSSVVAHTVDLSARSIPAMQVDKDDDDALVLEDNQALEVTQEEEKEEPTQGAAGELSMRRLPYPQPQPQPQPHLRAPIARSPSASASPQP